MFRFLLVIVSLASGSAQAQTKEMERLFAPLLRDELALQKHEKEMPAPPQTGIQIIVNPQLETFASQAQLNDKARKIGVLRYQRQTSLFVEDELLLASSDPDLIEKTVAALKAKPGKTLKLDPPRTRRSPPVQVQRVFLSSATPTVGPVLTRVAKDAPGHFDGIYEVSSEAARKTLLTALATHLGGTLTVSINWIFQPDTLENEILLESFNAAGTGFVNPFDLPYLNGDGVARIGVTGAWQVLKAAGVLDEDNFATPPNRIIVGVVDQGFHNAVDLRNPEINGVPVDTPGTSTCSGAPCPWHGSAVAEIMAARLGNVRAVAGPAGPVADRVILQSLEGYESWSLLGWIAGLADSVGDAPRVVNMSFSTSVPALWEWTTVLYDIGIGTLAVRGTLVVASAGNDGIDVDAISCPESIFADCYETMRRMPCELIGVICVGAIGNNDVQITNFSAVGALPGTAGQDGGTVDIFAPGRSILSGASPLSTDGPIEDGRPRRVSGTSESAPLVAGTIALIAAADPSLSPDELRQRLLLNASTNESDLPPGVTPDPRLIRWLNAERPVRFTLKQRFSGTDFAPKVEIVRPRSGLGTPVVELNAPVSVTARIVDVEDGLGCCLPQWTVDGTPRPDLSGSEVEITFDEDRTYEVEVSITDSAGQTDSDNMSIRARP